MFLSFGGGRVQSFTTTEEHLPGLQPRCSFSERKPPGAQIERRACRVAGTICRNGKGKGVCLRMQVHKCIYIYIYAYKVLTGLSLTSDHDAYSWVPVGF